MNRCIASYLELCRPFQLPAPWSSCQADESSLLGPSDPAAALSLLTKRHKKQQLSKSGIVRTDPAGQLALHPMLALPDVGIVVLLDSSTGQLRNLVTETGGVLGDKAPVFEVLGDQFTLDALKRADQAVFVTESITDTVLLRSFGMAAAPIAGLVRLNQQSLDLLCQHYGLKQGLSDREQVQQDFSDQDDHGCESVPNSQRPLHAQDTAMSAASCDPTAASRLPSYMVPESGYAGKKQDDFVRLTLVRWTPHLMSETDPASMRLAIDELKALKHYRRLDTYEVHQWTPPDSELAAIRFALSRGEPNWIKGTFLDSVYSSIGTIDVKAKEVVVALPQDIAGAVEHLHDAMLVPEPDDKSCERRKDALHNYHRVVERQITRPMLRQAAAATDPVGRALRLQFSQLNALFLEKAPIVREHMMLGVVEPREGSVKGGDKSVSELLAICNQLVSLAKEITKSNPCSMSAPSSLPAPKPNLFRRFADSDLARQN
jgi:hypothetical protein